MAITKYKGFDAESPELIEEIKKAQERGGNRVDWKLDIIRQGDLPAGSTKSPKPTRMRILPPHGDMRTPWVAFKQHFIFVKSLGKKIPMNCLKMVSNYCPICALADEMRNDPDPDMQKMGDEGKAKDQYAVNAIFLTWGGEAVPETHQGVKVFNFSAGIYKGTAKSELGGLLRLSREYDFTHPVTGCPVEVCKNVDGANKQTDTSYTVALVKARQQFNGAWVQVPAASPLGGDNDEALIDAVLEGYKPMNFLTRVLTLDEALLKLNASNNDQPEKPAAKGLPAGGRIDISKDRF